MLNAAAQGQIATPTPAASPTEEANGLRGYRGGGGILAHLTEALELTGTQQAQVAQILEAARPQAQANRAEAMAKRKALVESVSAQIMPLLTPDQQTKFSAMVQKVENGPAGEGNGLKRFGGKGKFGREGTPGAAAAGGAMLLQRLTTQLGLTADQQAQVKPILEAAHTQVAAVREDKSLTPQEKFAKIKETMEGARSQINGILTPAQQQQLEALKMKWKGGAGGEASPAPTTTGT